MLLYVVAIQQENQNIANRWKDCEVADCILLLALFEKEFTTDAVEVSLGFTLLYTDVSGIPQDRNDFEPLLPVITEELKESF